MAFTFASPPTAATARIKTAREANGTVATEVAG
jgi:hypothetical protein